jgi:hypothetical protein
LCVDWVAVHWVRRADGRRLFPCSVPDPIQPTVHQTFDGLVSSLELRVASPELLRAHLRPALSGGLPARVSALTATSPRRVHVRETSQASHVPSAGVHSLSTVSSAPRLRSLFHPRAAHRALSPVQGLLTPCSAPASSAGAAPLPLARPVLGGPLGPTSTPGVVPRLRGFDPHGGACSFHR